MVYLSFVSHLRLLLLLALVTSVHAQTEISQANIGTAVSLFISNPTTAIQTYGKNVKITLITPFCRHSKFILLPVHLKRTRHHLEDIAAFL